MRCCGTRGILQKSLQLPKHDSMLGRSIMITISSFTLGKTLQQVEGAGGMVHGRDNIFVFKLVYTNVTYIYRSESQKSGGGITYSTVLN